MNTEYRKIICDHTAKLKPKSLLELGCHKGLNLSYIKDSLCNIVNLKVAGCDCNMAFVNEDLDIICWDLMQFPYPYKDESFDVVLIAATLILFDEYEAKRILNEAKRIAKKAIVLMEPYKICNPRSSGEICYMDKTANGFVKRYFHNYKKLLETDDLELHKIYWPGDAYDYDYSLIIYKK